MKKEIEEGKFIEWAEVHGKFYGTSFQAIKSVGEAGKVCILDIDVQGCRLVRKAGLPAKFVFIAPPSLEVIEKHAQQSPSFRYLSPPYVLSYVEVRAFFPARNSSAVFEPAERRLRTRSSNDW